MPKTHYPAKPEQIIAAQARFNEIAKIVGQNAPVTSSGLDLLKMIINDMDYKDVNNLFDITVQQGSLADWNWANNLLIRNYCKNSVQMCNKIVSEHRGPKLWDMVKFWDTYPRFGKRKSPRRKSPRRKSPKRKSPKRKH